MKTIIFSLVTFFLMTTAKAAILGQYRFNVGAESSASFVDSSVQFSTISVAGGVIAAYPSGQFRTSGWDTSLNSSKYIEYTITPVAATDKIDLSLVRFNSGFSSDTSFDMVVKVYFGNDTTESLTSGTATLSPSLSNPSFSFSSGPSPDFGEAVTVRMFTYGGQDSSSYIQFDTLTPEGEITAVPEPINVALALFGITFAGVGVGRKLLKKKA